MTGQTRDHDGRAATRETPWGAGEPPRATGHPEQHREQGLTVAQLARAAGVSPHTVRYYEREGLLPAPPREGTGAYRRYPAATVRRLGFIKSLQQAGFTLRDIRQLLTLADDPQSCGAVQSLARERLAAVRARMEALRRCAEVLEALIASCQRREEPRCHLFEQPGFGRGEAR